MKLQIGRHFYGAGAIAYGVITLVWHQINSLGSVSRPEILIYVAAFGEIIGGLALQWQRTMRLGSLVISSVFSVFAIYWIPKIVENPLVYGFWGNFFELFSVVLGGIIVFASTIRNDGKRTAKIALVAYRCFGICVISFSLYQLFYLTYTAGLVPLWIPFGQMFWAVATTIAFALAAFAIISGHKALLASRLLVTMFIGFGLLVWIPACIIAPHELTNWISNAENLAVTGSVWIVADFLSRSKLFPLRWPFAHVH